MPVTLLANATEDLVTIRAGVCLVCVVCERVSECHCAEIYSDLQKQLETGRRYLTWHRYGNAVLRNQPCDPCKQTRAKTFDATPRMLHFVGATLELRRAAPLDTVDRPHVFVRRLGTCACTYTLR